MAIRPIRTDADHRDALVEIDRPWGAAQGTADGDKLDVLITLVEAYESHRWPIETQSPRETLKPPAPAASGRRPARRDRA